MPALSPLGLHKADRIHLSFPGNCGIYRIIDAQLHILRQWLLDPALEREGRKSCIAGLSISFPDTQESSSSEKKISLLGQVLQTLCG